MDMRLPNDGANAGYWRKQLRGNDGKFIKMGGGVIFDISLPGFTGIARGLGFFIGNLTPDIAIIEVRDNKTIPKGRYQVPHKDITGVKAIVPDADSVEAPEQKLPLSDSIPGFAVHKKKLASIARILKSEGRFAVPRQTSSDHWGTDSDVSKGARADYGKVYESSTLLKSKYSSFEVFWEKVKSLSVNTDAQSPNDLAQIPEEMKEINREYAVHFLGLKPDGLITVYRNAVNNKITEVDSAAGYVSTDRELAYDYNSQRENIAANGRYEIDVKPDEIVGMIGYSQAEDEFAFVIGTGVTSQEGRVRRVGDLEKIPFPAPWLDPYEKNIVRSQGGTPYRHHALGGQFDFHEVEDFGDTLTEFFQKYKLSPDDIKAKFDQLYGEGSYDEYKESGNTITFNSIKRMFVSRPNGKIGLDITKIPGGYDGHLNQSGYGDTQNPESFKNDLTDNTLKMMAVFQELTGEPFFTHRSRDYVPGQKPAAEELPLIDDDMEPTEAEIQAVKWYTDTGYWEANKHLREGEPLSDQDNTDLQVLLSFIGRSTLENDRTVYRGRPVVNPQRLAEINALKPGDKFIDRGIMSTSESEEKANFYAQMELDNNVIGRVMFEIDLPAGTRALPISDSLASYGSQDKEVLLPPNTALEVVDVSTDASGKKRIKLKLAKVLPDTKVSIIETKDSKNARDNYAGTHAAPGPFSDVSANILNIENVMPDIMDKTKGPQYYRTGHNVAADKESFDALYDLTGDPNQTLYVYRAVPEGVEEINDGDWVSLSRTYAEEHLESTLLGRGTVIYKKVKASELYTDGDSINEFGWDSRKPTDATDAPEISGSRATTKQIKEIWDPALVNTFDEKAAAKELYELMLQEGVTAEQIAMLDPQYREAKKIFPDAEDLEDWAVGAVELIRREWNGSPGDSTIIQAMQPVAKELFDLQNTYELHGWGSTESIENSKKHLEAARPAYEAFVKAAYKNTQKFFEERGIKTLVVYRGSGTLTDISYLTEPAEVQGEVRPLSSWTVDPNIARGYGSPLGIFMRAEVPVSQVMSIAFSGGMGTQIEKEVVLLGPPEKIMGVLGKEREKLINLDSDVYGVIDVVSEEAAQERIEPGLDNWMPVLFDLLDSVDEDESVDWETDGYRGNELQSKFIEASGFNGKPKLVTQEEFDAIDGDTLYRAVTDKKFVDDYLNSETQFAGTGTFGNGTYTTNKRNTAESYAGDSLGSLEDDIKALEERVMELKLTSDANILDVDVEDWKESINELIDQLREKALEFGANPAQMQAISWKLTDSGNWSNIAIMLGYDAIRVPREFGEYYTIILNRGKVIVNGKSRA